MDLTVEFPGSSFKTLSIFLDGLLSFGDELRIDARRTQLILSTRNLSLTGQALIRLSPRFFDKYLLTLDQEQNLKCRLLSKKLRMVFRKNLANVASLLKCTIHIDDRSSQEGTEYSRINLGLEYQNGVKKKHSLWFSESDNIDQLYPTQSPFEFSANPNLFSSYTSFFNNQEVSEIVLECTPTSVTMRSYSNAAATTKDSNPLETTVQINSADFQRYTVTEDVVMVFNLKEFKSVLSFMEAIQAPLFARFEEAGKPIVFYYKDSNVIAEFALVTTDYEIEEAQSLYNSMNISIASGTTPSTSRVNHSRNVRAQSPANRSETSHDTQPEPDTANIRRLAQRNNEIETHPASSSSSSSIGIGPSTSNKRQSHTSQTTSSHKDALKRLKTKRDSLGKRRIANSTDSNDESSPSLIMIEPEFEQSYSNQRMSLGSRNADFPFESSLESFHSRSNE